MQSPAQAVTLEVLQGADLQSAIDAVRNGPLSVRLWEDLAATQFEPDLSTSFGARVTLSPTAESFSVVSIPFKSGRGESARLVWDNVKGQVRTAYGKRSMLSDGKPQINIYELVNNEVQQSLGLIQQSDTELDLVDSRGHRIQQVNLHRGSPGTAAVSPSARLAAAAGSNCQICGVVVDILAGVVACGIWGYFVCDAACAGLTAGTGVVICSIVCAVLTGLACYGWNEAMKEGVCSTWCG